MLLSRKAQACFGLLVRLPHQLPSETERQLIDVLQLMLKVFAEEAIFLLVLMNISSVPLDH